MSWREVVITGRAKLDLQLGYLAVRDEKVRKIHLSEISLLIIESTTVSLTAALLAELTRQGIKVIFCDEKRNPSAELMPYYGAHDTSGKVRKQTNWSEKIRGEVWTEIIRNKIINQSKVLELFDKKEKDMLNAYAAEILRQVDYPLEISADFSVAKIISTIGMFFTDDEDLLGSLCRYMEVCNKLLETEIFVLYHLSLFLTKEEIAELYREAAYRKIYLVRVEGALKEIEQTEKILVIDDDMCIVRWSD